MVLAIVKDVTRAVVRELSETESNIVKAYFSGNYPDIEEENYAVAARIYDSLVEHKHRIACDCNLDGNHRPTLHACKPMDLHTMPTSVARNLPHQPPCLFANRRPIGDSIKPSFPKIVGDEQLAVHGPYTDPNANNSSGGGGGGTGSKLPLISRVLYTALWRAGVNKLRRGDLPSAQAQAEAVRRAASKLVLAKDSQTTILLQEMLETHGFMGFEDDEGQTDAQRHNSSGISLVMKLKDRIKAKSADWPTGSRPQGFLLAVVKGFSAQKRRNPETKENETVYALDVVGWERPLYVEVRPKIFAEGGRFQRRPPYIAVVSFANPDRTSQDVYGMRCFMQPCLADDCWFPVDSQNERDTVDVIRDWCETLPADWNVEIKKPLQDEQVTLEDGSSGPCRADFVLTVRDGAKFICSVAIETMGFIDAAYHQSKTVTHPRMLSKHYYLVQHDKSVARGLQHGADELFKEQLDGVVFNKVQPYYESIDGCPRVPPAPR